MGMDQRDEMIQGMAAAVKELTGFTDQEMTVFMSQPRTPKILGRVEALARTRVVFEVVQARGCVAGHRPGDRYLFPGGSVLDLQLSTARLCPFLMPPMARIMWLVQERVWEGLDPLPLYASGHCDDVGLDCGGWGRVVIEARIMAEDEAGLLG